jgi:hypothetical protein
VQRNGDSPLLCCLVSPIKYPLNNTNAHTTKQAPFSVFLFLLSKGSGVASNSTCLNSHSFFLLSKIKTFSPSKFKTFFLCSKPNLTMMQHNVVLPKDIPVPPYYSYPLSRGTKESCYSYKKFLNHVELGGANRINTWLDCMKASSPTQIRASSILNSSLAPPEDEIGDWMVSISVI